MLHEIFLPYTRKRNLNLRLLNGYGSGAETKAAWNLCSVEMPTGAADSEPERPSYGFLLSHKDTGSQKAAGKAQRIWGSLLSSWKASVCSHYDCYSGVSIGITRPNGLVTFLVV